MWQGHLPHALHCHPCLPRQVLENEREAEGPLQRLKVQIGGAASAYTKARQNTGRAGGMLLVVQGSICSFQRRPWRGHC